MNDDLESKIEIRRKQAEQKNFSHKAWIIGRYLGTFVDEDGRVTNRNSRYQDNEFDIEYSFYCSDEIAGHGAKIEFKKQVVYEEGGNRISAYNPGPWERKFDELYTRAEGELNIHLALDRASEEEKQDIERRNLKKRWGI